MDTTPETSNEDHPFLQNKVTILNGFTNEEIHKIMQAVRGCFPKGTDLIFAKTTKSSLGTVLRDLIIDMSGDHEYLKKNPPGKPQA